MVTAYAPFVFISVVLDYLIDLKLRQIDNHLPEITCSLSTKIQCGAVITRSAFSKILAKDNHSSPVRARYGVYFADQISDLYSAPVTA